MKHDLELFSLNTKTYSSTRFNATVEKKIRGGTDRIKKIEEE